jgi:hypothetical protein
MLKTMSPRKATVARSAQADRHGGIMTNPIMPPGPARLTEDGRCPHQPPCPGGLEPDRLAARLVARYPDQGWSLLCNGVVLLDDGGQLLPDGRIVSLPPRENHLAAADSR